MPLSSSTDAPFDAGTVAIYGVGLIGGSLAAALKRRGISRRILGVGRNGERLEAARTMGLIDESFVDPDAAARESDFLVFCTPVDQIAASVRRAAAHCRPDAILTDAGSVKGPICRALEGSLPPGPTFLGAHPIAGSEKQGFEHSNPNLYDDKVCVLTPTASTPALVVERLRNFWSGVGSRVLEMSPDEHDAALALTSHAPHVIASALAAMLPEDHRKFAGRSFQLTTRIAAGDPDLWVAILRSNAAAVLPVLQQYQIILSLFRTELQDHDHSGLTSLLGAGAKTRALIEGREPRRHPGHADLIESTFDQTWQNLAESVPDVLVDEVRDATATVKEIPKIAAAALSAMLPADFLPLVGTGFRDTTSMVSKHPDVAAGELLSNAAAVLDRLKTYEHTLDSFRIALQAGDDDALRSLLLAGKRTRDALP